MEAALDIASASKIELSTANKPVRKALLPGQTPQGQHILAVLVKRTYDIRRGVVCIRAEQDHKLFPADVFFADPLNSSVKFESDYVPFKVATDVVLNGKAFAPNGRPTTHLIAELSIGQVQKHVRIIGDRVCHYRKDKVPLFTDPVPFASMDLRYERAYGGVDIYSNTRIPFPYGRNPLGRGFAVKNIEKSVQGLNLPNVEDFVDPLTPERLCCDAFDKWAVQPMPAGLGWLPKTWLPRAQLAGILPADRAVEKELREAYTKLVPAEHRALYAKTQLPDMDFRFFNGASSGLPVPFLQGGELIRTVNLTEEGNFDFYLPVDRIKIGVDIGEGVVEPQVVMHTAMIQMGERKLDLVWRGAVPYPGPDWFLDMQKMDIFVE